MTPPKPPERGFELEELFIDETVFPESWKGSSSGLSSPCKAAPLNSGCRSINSGRLSFYFTDFPGGGAFETIHVYLSAEHAAKDFQRLLDRHFSVGKYVAPWSVPDELPYQSPFADQFYFACSAYGIDPKCQMLGRYEEFIVRFHIRKITISYEDLERVLQAIDGRIAFHLSE